MRLWSSVVTFKNKLWRTEMNDCWDCIHLEKRNGGFQYCLLYGTRKNVDANKDRCGEWKVEEPTQETLK